MHSDLADWFGDRGEWGNRDFEEAPWQLLQAGLLDDLRQLLLAPSFLVELLSSRGNSEVLKYWMAVRAWVDGDLDELIAEAVEECIKSLEEYLRALLSFVDYIADLLDEAGLYRELLLRLRTLSLELEEVVEDHDKVSTLTSLRWLADLQREMGHYNKAKKLYVQCMKRSERLLGPNHPDTLVAVGNFGLLYRDKGDFAKAQDLGLRCLKGRERVLGAEHPETLIAVANLGNLYEAIGDHQKSEACYMQCLEAGERLLGPEHPITVSIVGNLGTLYNDKGDYSLAELWLVRCLHAREKLLGPEHLDTLIAANNLASLFRDKGDYEKAEALLIRCLYARERMGGPKHPATNLTVHNLAVVLSEQNRYAEAILLRRRHLGWCWEHNGTTDPDTLEGTSKNWHLPLICGHEKAALKAAGRRKEIAICD